MMSYSEEGKKMESYASFGVDQFKIDYKQVGPISDIVLDFNTLNSTGELPIYPLNEEKKFKVEISSEEGPMKVVVTVENYAL
jgi:hypothetical protein